MPEIHGEATSGPGRQLDPRAPWPTANQVSSRTMRLVVFVVVSQYYLNSLGTYVSEHVMGWAWFIGGTLAGIATMQNERYLSRRRQWR